MEGGPTDQQMTAIEQESLSHSPFPIRPHHNRPRQVTQGHMGKHQGRSGGGGRGENGNKSLYCGFHRKEWVRQGKQV